LSKRIVDEDFVRGLEEDRRRRLSLGEHFDSLENLIKRSDREILKSPKGGLRSGLKRFLFRLIAPVLRPFIEHQRALELERLQLLRDLWKQADERLTAAEDRLLQAYIKHGESIAALRVDILSGFNDKVAEARSEAADEALATVQGEIRQQRGETAREMRRFLADVISRTDLVADRIGRDIEMLRLDLKRVSSSSRQRLEGFGTEVERMRERLDEVQKRSRLLARDIAASDAQQGPPAEFEPLQDEEYAAHQDRFRGSHEEIERRQRLYIEYFRDKAPVLDAGCGRGEFLSLLKKEGIGARGIDLNRQMVENCAAHGFDAVQADLFEHLAGLKDNSLGGLFAAQVVEHLDAPQLRTFLQQAQRVLKPGGVLVMETVNPESVFALTQFYYLDATHKAPLPPLLLQFLTERAGFSAVEIKLLSSLPEEEMLRTVEPEAGLPPALEDAFARINADVERLNKFLYGYLEYAVIAEK